MAPEIIDLTSDLDDDELPSHPQHSPSSKHNLKFLSQKQFKPPPPSPSRQSSTPKRSTWTSLLSPSTPKLSSPRTPIHRTPSQSWDESIPLSLRKGKVEISDKEAIDSLLQSPSSRRNGGLDSGLGESMSGSERSTQELTGLGEAATSFLQDHANTERAGLSNSNGVNAIPSSSQNSPYNHTATCSNLVEQLSNYPPTISIVGNKRKRSDVHHELATGPILTTSPLPSIPTRERSEEAPITGTLSSPQTSSNHMSSARINSITPYIPSFRKSTTRSQDNTSPPRISRSADKNDTSDEQSRFFDTASLPPVPIVRQSVDTHSLHEPALLQREETSRISQRLESQSLIDPQIFTHHISSSNGEVEMQFESRDGESFPPGYDRGRFPMQRRRRGGAKYGTPRVNAFPKLQKTGRISGARPAAEKEYFSAKLPSSALNTEAEQQEATKAPLNQSSVQRDFAHLYRASGDLTRTEMLAAATSQSVQSLQCKGSTSLDHSIPTAVRANESGGNLAWSALDNDRVTEFFFDVLGPAIKRIRKHFIHQLSQTELEGVGKRVSIYLVNDDLLDFLRKNSFSTDKPQRKKIRKQIGKLYNQEMNIALQIRRGQAISLNRLKMEMHWAIIPPKSTTSTDSSIRNHDRPPARAVEGLGGGPATTLLSIYSDGQSGKQQFKRSAQRSKNGRFSSTKTRSSKTPSDVPPIRSGNALSPRSAANFRLPSAVSPAQSSQAVSSIDQPSRVSEAASREFARRPEQSLIHNIRRQWPRSKERTIPQVSDALSSVSRHAQRTLNFPRTMFEPQLENLVAEATLKMTDDGGSRPNITRNDQEELLKHDYVSKSVSQHPPRLNAIKSRIVDPTARPERQMPALLRTRELGSSYRTELQSELRLRTVERLKPWRKWKGASSDVVTVAWAPDSLKYAAGAAAHTNAEDLQYNRPCNLMLGELTSNLLWELPDHRTKRPPPSTVGQGYNSIQETYNACDPMVYQTINAISFSPDGEHMYTASRDQTVKVWDITEGHNTCIHTLDHGSVVAGVDTSRVSNMRVFATACQSIKDSIRVYYGSDTTTLNSVIFSSSRAEIRQNLRILPECIRWGPTSHNHHLLLAGFSQWDQLGPAEIAKEGQLCLWDMSAEQSLKITPSSQSVSTVTWHPSLPFFATGGAPGGNLSKRQTTKTVVRTYDPRYLTRFAMEYESPARDIQDITFHPLNTNIVTAGCTDGTSFVWDYRWPDTPLHRLRHGDALMELDHSKPREEVDTGVLLSLWGPEGSLYYSGSSDGVVKAWDIRRHPADVHIRDVAHVGAAIQDGAFSPDFTHLLVGDADGAIHVLSSAPCGPPSDDPDDSDNECITESPIRLIRASDGNGKRLDLDDDNPGTEGIETARQLLASGQLDMHPVYGPGKGSQYLGPYSKDEQRTMREDGSLISLSRNNEDLQVSDKSNHLDDIEAAFRKAHAERRKWEFEDREKRNATLIRPPTLISAVYEDTGQMERDCPPAKNSDLSDVDQSRPETQCYTPKVQGLLIKACGETGDGKDKESMVRARRRVEKEGLKGAIDNAISEGEMMEEDFWWPRLGEEEVSKALARD